MTNIIVVTFADAAQSASAAQKFRALETTGDITIFEMALLKKNPDGTVVVLKTDEQAGTGTLAGMAVGGLVGALAGPVGLLVGMFTGTLAGAAAEADYYDFSEDFGKNIADIMQPGTVALVAEIDEDNPITTNAVFLPFSVTVLRSDVDDVYGQYEEEQIEAIDNEVAAEREKIKTNVEEKKEAIRNKIAELKQKRKERLAGWEQKIKDTVADKKANFEDFKARRIRKKIEKTKSKLSELESELHEIEG
jgi:uncharacterized membrane protein